MIEDFCNRQSFMRNRQRFSIECLLKGRILNRGQAVPSAETLSSYCLYDAISRQWPTILRSKFLIGNLHLLFRILGL